MKDRTYVALGCSTTRDYAFLAPFTVCFWKTLIGFEPIVMLVGSKEEWLSDPELTVVHDSLVEMGTFIRFVGRVDGYPDATAAQNCRQHGSVFDLVGDNDWLLPADMDLWPLRKEPYHHHVGSNFRAIIEPYWNGDHFIGKAAFLKAVALGKRSQTIPTCHVAMRARDWRKIYGLTPGEDIAATVKRTLDDWFTRFPKDDFNTWMSDQDIMTWKLCLQEWFPDGTPPHHDPGIHASGDVLFVGRRGHPPVDRLCRSVPSLWQLPFDPKAWVDAHLPKNPMAPEHWCKLLPIIEAMLPQHLNWVRYYHKSYVEAM